MSRYDELGFFDFEDFVEELNEEELFLKMFTNQTMRI